MRRTRNTKPWTLTLPHNPRQSKPWTLTHTQQALREDASQKEEQTLSAERTRSVVFEAETRAAQARPTPETA